MPAPQLTRRTFSRAALCTFPAIVPASVLGQGAPSNQLSIGFIGTGNNGTNWMLRFLQDARVRVRAVCDVNREGGGYWEGTVRGREPARRIVDEHYGDNSCLALNDFRELLVRDDVDAIYIGTPDHWHAPMAIAAARAGKHIYSQKPLSLTVRGGRAMADAVKTAGVVWQTGSQQRSDRNFRIVCELARNGRLGRLHTVRVGLPGGRPDYGKTARLTETRPVPEGLDYEMWVGPAPYRPYAPARIGVNFRWVSDYSGGQVTDFGAHHIDIAQWGLGMDSSGPVAIRNPRAKFPPHPIYDTATEFRFECEYSSGVRLVCSDKERGGVRFEGSNGWAWANRGTHEVSARDIVSDPPGRGEIRLYRSSNHVTNFIDSCITGKPTVAPIEAAHRSVSIAHLGNIALRKGRALQWDPANERIIDDRGAEQLLDRPRRSPWELT
ncbi:MAG: Gfo/Idh/MocA family oxidoreductase [Bryobacterales bacterium]|nr:Gfo/Idh/MocA family oxidoreductase [Bryobacterales bacterium]